MIDVRKWISAISRAVDFPFEFDGAGQGRGAHFLARGKDHGRL